MRTTVLLLILLWSFNYLFATHNRAGEITFEQIDDLTVKATIVTYTKTSSIPADRDSLRICWGDGQCEMLQRVNDKGEELTNDYKVNYYIGQHQYNNMGTFQISMTDPNRNGQVLNVNPPNSDVVQFHLQSSLTLINMSALTSNQSPTLLEPPIDIGFVRQPFMHTPNAIDIDGDSIAYELITPLMENDQPVPNYMQVDEIGAGADNSYSFDELTGLFIWNSPQVVGEYNIAMKIKSYRNGELVDMIVRDMQILIRAEENLPPLIEGLTIASELIQIKAGQTLDFSFTSRDMEDGAVDGSPNLTLTGEPLQLGASATLEPAWGLANGNFKWKVTENEVRSQPYQIVIKSTDSEGAATFKVIQIQVKDASTSTKNLFKTAGYKLFPNPSNDISYLKIRENQLNEAITISIFDNLGRKLRTQYFDKGSELVLIPTEKLGNGIYLIHIQTKNQSASTFLQVQH